MGFQFLPKSVTLDDTEGLLCSCFENTCIFGVFFGIHHEFLNEDTHMRSGSRANKFYTDIHEGCVCVKTKRGHGHQKTVRLSTMAISSNVTRKVI